MHASLFPEMKSRTEVPSLEVATPSRARAVSSQNAAAEGGTGVPPEAAGLKWPTAFLESPRGERLDLSEDNSCATRRSGVGRGIGFLGPLKVEKGKVYFEIEITSLESARSQTMAIGVSSSLPAARPILAERAKDIGDGCIILGYDLPKLFVNGKEEAKIPARDWRPLKELVVGSRVGLLVQRQSGGMTGLSVYMNGVLKASVTTNKLPQFPLQLWGIVDVQGTVRSVRLLGPAHSRRAQPVHGGAQSAKDAGASGGMASPPPSLPPTCPVSQQTPAQSSTAAASLAPQHALTRAMLSSQDDLSIALGLPPSARQQLQVHAAQPSAASASASAPPSRAATLPIPPAIAATGRESAALGGGPPPGSVASASSRGHPASVADRLERELAAIAPGGEGRGGGAGRGETSAAASPSSGRRSRKREPQDGDEGAPVAKRRQSLTHPCGCCVHLISHSGAVVHVPQTDFVIGRNPAAANLTLDSPLVPNMASRKHARLLSGSDIVEIIDCGSVNGTWLNGQRIERSTLRQGDVIVIGSPPHGLAPAEFRFSISMPPT